MDIHILQNVGLYWLNFIFRQENIVFDDDDLRASRLDVNV